MLIEVNLKSHTTLAFKMNDILLSMLRVQLNQLIEQPDRLGFSGRRVTDELFSLSLRWVD